MKCTRCGRKEATVHSYIAINNKQQQMDLCDDCARELQTGMVGGYGDIFGKFFGGGSSGLFPGLFKLFDAPATHAVSCPYCKTSVEEFSETGFVGCPHCYEVFELLIVQTAKKVQQSDRHVGKTPVGAQQTGDDEERLKTQLQAAIDSGDYAKLTELSEKLRKLVGGKPNGEV